MSKESKQKEAASRKLDIRGMSEKLRPADNRSVARSAFDWWTIDARINYLNGVEVDNTYEYRDGKVLEPELTNCSPEDVKKVQ